MTQATQPLVSIIVPVYNVERYVDECLASIRAQTYANLEILLVEDCSTDGSLKALEPHLEDPRMRLIRHECNSGLSAARNTGIEAASGDFVLFVDSDDAIAPELIETCLAHVTKTGVDVVVFDFVAFQDGDTLPKVGAAPDTVGSRELEGVEYLKLPHFAWLKFIRVDLLSDTRLRFPVGYYYEDWPFHWDLGFSATSIAMLNGGWYCYRQRGTSITASGGRKLLDQFKVQQLVLESVKTRGGDAESAVLFSKAHVTFWGVLTRIDADLLAEALGAAKELRNAIRSLTRTNPQGIRATTMALLLSLPDSLAGLGLGVLRKIKMFLSANTIVRSQG